MRGSHRGIQHDPLEALVPLEKLVYRESVPLGGGGTQLSPVAGIVGGSYRPGGAVIPLDNFGNQGTTLSGFEDSAFAGRSVSGAGDVNGDGFADLIVGAHSTNALGSDRGEAYVVFAPLPKIYAVG